MLIRLLMILLTMIGLFVKHRPRAPGMPRVRLVMVTIPGVQFRRKFGALVAALLFSVAVLPGVASAHEIASTGTAAQSSQLGSALVPNLPPGPTTMAMARFTMDPGAKLEDFGVPGPEIIVVESGTITVGVRGETEDEEDIQAMLDLLKRSTPDAAPPATPSGDLFSYTMTAGDRLVVPPDMPQNVRNMGTGPATFVAAAVTPVAPRQQDQPWPPAGVSQRVPTTGTTIQPMSVGYDVSALLGTNAAILSIERMTFASGATYSITDNHTPQVWYIEQGSMQFSGADSEVWYSKPASAWHGETAGTPTPVTGAFLVAGDSVQLDARATLTFSSAGSGPVIATVFSVSTEQPLATPDS
jgi:quercetin dioxygenase-like cupin family protein